MSVASAHFSAFPHWPLDAWVPQFPPGDLRAIYLHWSGGDYQSVYPAYHYCIAWRDGTVYVVQTNDLAANLRDVYAGDAPYAAHTYRRNSYAAGLSIMAMRAATPEHFGAYPMLDAQIDAMCLVAGALARSYGLDVTPQTIRTHAEAALEDGYFGAGSDEVRWDIARLRADAAPLREEEAATTAGELRCRIQTAPTSIRSAR